MSKEALTGIEPGILWLLDLLTTRLSRGSNLSILDGTKAQSLACFRTGTGCFRLRSLSAETPDTAMKQVGRKSEDVASGGAVKKKNPPFIPGPLHIRQHTMPCRGSVLVRHTWSNISLPSTRFLEAKGASRLVPLLHRDAASPFQTVFSNTDKKQWTPPEWGDNQQLGEDSPQWRLVKKSLYYTCLIQFSLNNFVLCYIFQHQLIIG